MHKVLTYGAYGWVALSGTLHFLVDVVSQKLRGVRAPSPETTLYWGLNSSFALGQVVLGALGVFLAWRAPELLREVPVVLVSVFAGLAWLAITFLFLEYREPRMNAVLINMLLWASLLASRR